MSAAAGRATQANTIAASASTDQTRFTNDNMTRLPFAQQRTLARPVRSGGGLRLDGDFAPTEACLSAVGGFFEWGGSEKENRQDEWRLEGSIFRRFERVQPPPPLRVLAGFDLAEGIERGDFACVEPDLPEVLAEVSLAAAMGA